MGTWNTLRKVELGNSDVSVALCHGVADSDLPQDQSDGNEHRGHWQLSVCVQLYLAT